MNQCKNCKHWKPIKNGYGECKKWSQGLKHIKHIDTPYNGRCINGWEAKDEITIET